MRVDVIRSLTLAVALAAGWSSAFAQTPSSGSEPAKPAERSGTHVWIERPWGTRYFIYITQTWPITRKVAIQRNAKKGPDQSLMWQQVFEPITTIPVPNEGGGYANFSVVVIEFDKQGMVTTPHSHGSPLRGRLNRLQYITLSAGDGPTDTRYNLGHWFTGLGDISTHWAPGICTYDEYPTPFSKTSTVYLYGPKFEIDEYSSTFGCREWTYQLADDERPYIDVTSYVRIGKVYPKHTAIKDVIGFARFGDKKPIIGQHEGLWYCLHDCPAAEKPGPVTDIKAWAAKQGWKAPRPPTKAPTFPDPPAKSGTYPR